MELKHDPFDRNTQSAKATDMVVGVHHNKDESAVETGRYPEGVEVEEYIGMLRTFSDNPGECFIRVMGDLWGHAVYEIMNRKDDGRVYAIPWPDFFEMTEHVETEDPDSHSTDL